MQRLLAILLAATLVMSVGLSAAEAHALTRQHLQVAMQKYAEWRAPAPATLDGGTSSAYKGEVSYVVWMSNGAHLTVTGGTARHIVYWTSATGARTNLFTFLKLKDVAHRLDRLREEP